MQHQMAAAIVWLLVSAGTASAAERYAASQPAEGGSQWHVAPAHGAGAGGSADGDGSTARPWDLRTALAHPPSVEPGDTIWVHGGSYDGADRYYFSSKLKGTAEKPILVRNLPGTHAVIQPTLTINHGAHAWFWGLEVMNPDPNEYGRAEHTRLPAVEVKASGIKLINMVIHEGGQGVGAWADSEDCDIYGCLIFNNGWHGSNRGHGIYTQNRVGRKRIVDNIIFNQHTDGFGIHAYGSSRAYVNHYLFEGNTIFHNGGLDLLVGSGNPSQDITIRDNYIYSRRRGVRLGYGAHNKDVIFRDNYIAGAVHVEWWDDVELTGNTFVRAQRPLLLEAENLPALPKYRWDRNTYFFHRAEGFAAKLPGHAAKLSDPERPEETDEIFEFDQWKARTGFDAGSSFTVGDPTDVKVFLRPNQYEKGRANITVFNWDKKAVVEVDVSSVLAQGDRYEVRDAQHFNAPPVAQGVYGSGPISLPMKLTEVTQPVTTPRFEHTSEEFNVFVLLRVDP